MSYGGLLAALNNLTAARQAKSEANLEFDRLMTQSKGEIEEAENAINSKEQEIQYMNSIFENDLAAKMAATKDATVQSSLYQELNSFRLRAQAYLNQFKELVKEKLHKLEEAKDKLEARLSLKKETAKQDEQTAEARLKEERESEQKRLQLMYNNGN